MRLIHTTTFDLHEFFGAKVPEYAILSHTWDEHEVSFQEFQSRPARNGPGWRKILNCCNLARSEGIEWAWVDTCCIDKTSSAELSEAINSMFKWYEDATVCYAFLSDYQAESFGCEISSEQLASCRWFSRGWCLQELIAPRRLVFYDQDFQKFQDRNEMAALLAEVTGIGRKYLVGDASYRYASVAQRMSWLSRRQTTRVEDTAYCMLGLFEINMPLLYGEGQKAFIRLQEHIIAQSDDESIFAWADEDSIDITRLNGILAVSPRAFANSGNIVRAKAMHTERPPYTISHKGLLFHTAIFMTENRWESWFSECRSVALHCEVLDDSPTPSPIGFRMPVHPQKLIHIRLQCVRQYATSIWYRTDATKLIAKRTPIPFIWLSSYRELRIATTATHLIASSQNREHWERRQQRTSMQRSFSAILRMSMVFLIINMTPLLAKSRAGSPEHSAIMWLYMTVGWRMCQMTDWYLFHGFLYYLPYLGLSTNPLSLKFWSELLPWSMICFFFYKAVLYDIPDLGI